MKTFRMIGAEMTFSWKLIVVTALLALLGWQLIAHGPTLDPDLDGYVSYTQGLLTNWQLQAHRRLPGYPFLMAAVHSIFGGSIAVNMFWAHFVMLTGFAVATTLIIWRLFDFPVAAMYLAILSINSHFAHNSIMMLADLPFAITFYLTCALAALFWLARGRDKWLLAALLFLGCFVATSYHPSTNLRIQILVAVAAVVLLVRAGITDRAAIGTIAVNALSIAAISFAANAAVHATLQVRGAQVAHNVPPPNSSVFLQQWISYRMLLCLPPPANASASDLEIEKAKALAASRLGVPTDRFVPPTHHREFAELFQRVPVSLDQWRSRLWEHPLKPVVCALYELRSRYHAILRGITPFTRFGRHKVMITAELPPNSGSVRDQLFFTFGIDLSRLIPPDAPAAEVFKLAAWEVAKMLLVLLATVGGLVLLERRFPAFGWIVGLGTLATAFVLAVALPVELRHLGPMLPLLYLSQALFLVYLARPTGPGRLSHCCRAR